MYLASLLIVIYAFLIGGHAQSAKPEDEPKIIYTSPEEQVDLFSHELGADISNGVFYTQQALKEIIKAQGDGKLLAYLAPNKPQEKIRSDILDKVGPYILLEKVPKYDPESNVPFINDKSYNELLREKVERQGVKIYVTGKTNGFVGAAVLSDATPFNAFLPNPRTPIIILSLSAYVDVFVHEAHHLKQRDLKYMNKINSEIDSFAKKFQREKIPQNALYTLVYAREALKEAPAYVEQLDFMKKVHKQNANINTTIFHTAHVDKETGALLAPASPDMVFFRKKKIPSDEYKKIAMDSIEKSISSIYQPLERSLAALKENKNIEAWRGMCQIIYKYIPAGSEVSPQRRLPSCIGWKSAAAEEQKEKTPPGDAKSAF